MLPPTTDTLHRSPITSQVFSSHPPPFPTLSLLWHPPTTLLYPTLTWETHLLHHLTYLKLHSSTVTRLWRKYHFLVLFPFLCFALGKLEPHCNCLLSSAFELCGHMSTHTHIRTLAHSHAQYPFFFFPFRKQNDSLWNTYGGNIKDPKFPDLLMKVSHSLLKWSSSSFV